MNKYSPTKLKRFGYIVLIVVSILVFLDTMGQTLTEFSSIKIVASLIGIGVGFVGNATNSRTSEQPPAPGTGIWKVAAVLAVIVTVISGLLTLVAPIAIRFGNSSPTISDNLTAMAFPLICTMCSMIVAYFTIYKVKHS